MKGAPTAEDAAELRRSVEEERQRSRRLERHLEDLHARSTWSSGGESWSERQARRDKLYTQGTVPFELRK